MPRKPDHHHPSQGAGIVQHGDRLLVFGGVLTGAASLLHVAIIFGGPDWYRFFGAGEAMARLAARGSAYPAVVTTGIAAILGTWALYAFSGAGVIRRLPLLRPALVAIAAIYLGRGFLGVPLVLVMDDPYANQLRARMMFMVVTSLVCIGLGLCYAAGAARALRSSGSSGA
jgi:putative oxidoreductase